MRGQCIAKGTKAAPITAVFTLKEDYSRKPFLTILKLEVIMLAQKLLIVLTLLLLTAFQRSQGATITVGKPGKNGGKVVWKIADKTVEINVPKNATAEGKAELLAEALGKQGFKGSRDGAKVKINNVKKELIEKFKDDTNERDAVALAIPEEGALDFHLHDTASALAGLDEDGGESIFSASLGFGVGPDTFLATVDIPYSQAGGGISSLLTAMFADLQSDLPLAYQSALTLDLANEAIDFVYPVGAINGFVETFTSDLNAYSTLSITGSDLPDGGSTFALLMVSGVGILGFRGWKARRRLD